MHYTFGEYLLMLMIVISLSAFFQKPSPLYLRVFFFYFISLFAELTVMIYKQSRGEFNTGIANAWGIVEFCFYFFVIREVLVNKVAKKIILFIILIYPVLCMFILSFQKEVGFNPVNFTIGCVLVVIFCIYYFAELFQKTTSESLNKLPSFWIVVGIFVINVLSFPVYALISFMKQIPRLILNNIGLIYDFILVLTYTLFTIGFLCRIRISKSSS